MLKGIDVSSYQSTSYSTAGLSFVGIKVTEGLSYVNPNWVGQRATARAAGLVTIFYHYPHIANSPAAEADHCLSQINLAAGDVLCLDWEWYGQTVTDAQARAYKDAWLAYVKAKAPGHKVIMYCDRNSWLNVDTDSNAGDGLWIADYTTAGQPRIKAQWWFHQYTDAAPQGGDGDVANAVLFPDVDALRAWAGIQPEPKPAPTPAPIPTPVQEEDMPSWNAGTIVPGPQPTVALSPHGNAWKTATNRRLHLGMDHLGSAPSTAAVRVAIHNGTSWRVSTVDLTAAGGTVDVPMTATDEKVSLQTDAASVAFAIESW